MSTDAPPTPPGILPELQPAPGTRLRIARPVARRNPQWYRITNKADDTTLIDIYDEIGWFGITAAEFVKDLRAVATPKIELHINSPGGDVFDAVAIYNALRQHDATVQVIIDSLAASAASFIAMAGDTITATPNAMMMIHDALGLVIGNAADMREMADLLDKHSDNIASIYAARTSDDTATWRQRMSGEVWYNAEEALKAGLVDEIQGDDGRPVSDAWDLSIFGHADPAAVVAGDPPAPPADPSPPTVVDTAIAVHHTSTVEEPWDAGAVEKALPDGDQKSWKTVYAWYDSTAADDDGDGLPDAKSAWKFPHHTKISGPANLNGVRNGLARLSGSNIPEGDKAGVKSHLQAHLDDAPSDSTTSNGNESGDRRSYLGEPATWYLPRPAEGKEHPEWAMP